MTRALGAMLAVLLGVALAGDATAAARGVRGTVRTLLRPVAGVHVVMIQLGFMQGLSTADIFKALAAAGHAIDPERTSFYLRREIVLSTKRPGMARWRERLYARMLRNARPTAAFFQLPADRVVELGVRVEI